MVLNFASFNARPRRCGAASQVPHARGAAAGRGMPLRPYSPAPLPAVAHHVEPAPTQRGTSQDTRAATANVAPASARSSVSLSVQEPLYQVSSPLNACG